MKKLKKLSLKERHRLIRFNKNKISYAIIRNKNNIKNLSHLNIKSKKTVKEINLPTTFNLHTNTEETLKVMNDFRAIVDKNNPKLNRLNFDKMKNINSSSALMLAAEIDVWNNKVEQGLHARHKTWDSKVRALLGEMGFFELLDMNPIQSNEKINKNTTFLQFISGQKSEGSKAKELREKIEKVIGKELEEKIHLFEGLSEAFTNTAHHAYDDPHNEYDKWWITASYKKDDGKLIVSMYDRGKSIPKTIHKYNRWNEVKTYLSVDFLKNHSRLIEAAMKVSFKSEGKTRTTTQQSNRGKGFKQLLDFIKDNGKLTIISGKGFCTFTLKNNKLTTKRAKSLKYHLKGTLIEWEINLPHN
jgi:anti-sigma regulatory factor (Ser/Thr protein kinase)